MKLTDPKHQAISKTLRKSWNPIGLHEGDPEDEYNDYAPRVAEILAENDDALDASTQLASYLTWVRVHTIGLDSEKGCRDDAHAACIVVLKHHG